MPTIPSCSTGKVHFLVINFLNDCCIWMCLIVCMFVGISRRNYFKGGGGCETREKRIFPKMSESVILVGGV